MPTTSVRIEREKRTIRAMVRIYCRAYHTQSDIRSDGQCPECAELVDYALERLDKCPFGGGKPACSDCKVHCYKPAMRERVKQVMRYAGPRMIIRHPLMAIRHLIDGRRKEPAE